MVQLLSLLWARWALPADAAALTLFRASATSFADKFGGAVVASAVVTQLQQPPRFSSHHKTALTLAQTLTGGASSAAKRRCTGKRQRARRKSAQRPSIDGLAVRAVKEGRQALRQLLGPSGELAAASMAAWRLAILAAPREYSVLLSKVCSRYTHL
jgi:hypothetical protein